MMFRPTCCLSGSMAAACLLSLNGFGFSSAQAQGVATESQLEAVVVRGTQSPGLSPTLPSNTASKTAEQLKQQNLFNPEDALAQLPGLTVRKRYAGDRNANVGGRTFGTLQPGRALVYVDGYLISNFLGRFDAPRWNMVNDEALARVDVLYGPFSAIYPGNSIGTTVVMTERKPKGFEASVSLKYQHQPFKEYGSSGDYHGAMVSTRLASRTESGLWWMAGYQHQDSLGHPMTFASSIAGGTNQFTTTTPLPGPLVSGLFQDTDPTGKRRAIFGASSIDHTQQDTLNLRVGYEVSRTQELEGRVSWWQNHSIVHAETYLRDASGNPVWYGVPSGTNSQFNDGQHGFQMNDNAFAPSQRDESHRQLGLTWKTKHATGWNTSVVVTDYQIVGDADRSPNLAPGVVLPVNTPERGRATHRDGTGWNTFEWQGSYTPTPGDWTGGQHALTFGIHRNQYTLNNVVNVTGADWRNTETSNEQYFKGKTTIVALYAQDAWRLHEDWLLTSGVRWEAFRSRDGEQLLPALTPFPYPDRKLIATSPKLSLSWTAADDLMLKASAGRGVRFPNVDELFNGTKSSNNSVIKNDENLQPEVSNALELSAEKFWANQSIRAAYFRDDSRNTILRQSTLQNDGSTLTQVSNVDRVLSDGLELVWQSNDLFVHGLDITGHATWTNAKIKRNTRNQATEGKNWPRIPKQRYSIQSSYRVNDQWSVSGAWRWHGRMFNEPDNTDTNPEVYGGVSHVNQVDVRATWRLAKHWEWGFGIDNLTDHRAYQAHPLPQRTFHTSLSYSLQ